MARNWTEGALVFDLDGTLTDARNRVVPAVLLAIQSARRRGMKAILVTGRRYPELARRKRLLASFDRLVLEGGGLEGTRSRLRPTSDGAHELDRLAAWALGRGLEVGVGATCLSLDARARVALSRYPRRRRLNVAVNRNRLDVTLRGVDKGYGAEKAIAKVGARGFTAFGDADNDLSLFERAAFSVAVANATPRLKRAADVVTERAGGYGVSDFLARRVLGGNG